MVVAEHACTSNITLRTNPKLSRGCLQEQLHSMEAVHKIQPCQYTGPAGTAQACRMMCHAWGKLL